MMERDSIHDAEALIANINSQITKHAEPRESADKKIINIKAFNGSGELTIDLKMTELFLNILTQKGESEEFTFQIFPEGELKKEGSHAQVLHGTLEKVAKTLISKNQQGCGVYVTINKTDGNGRKKDNILSVRAFFVDLDGSSLDPVLNAPIKPHIIVESSPGRFHAYWIVEGIPLNDFSRVQKELAKRFDGDPAVNDLSRVMRLPGFYHLKSSPKLTKIIQENKNPPYNLDDFLISFGMSDFDKYNTNSINTSSNPVLNALKQHQLLLKKEEHPPGTWTIKCPWEALHTKKDSATKYYEPQNGNAFGGFKCFHAHCESKTIHDLLQFMNIQREPLEPLPLHRLIADPPPYPIEALGDVLAPAVRALQSIIKAPDAVCAQSVLGAAALACQPFANIEIDGRIIPLSLFLITVAESGERKSATDQVALQPIYAWQQMLVEVYRSEYNNYQRLSEAWEAQKKDFFKNIKQNTALTPFNIPEPIKPLEPLVLLDEPTYEGVVKLLAIGQPSIGIFSDEGGRFFGGHAMNRDNQIKTISGLSSLWDAKPINRSRAGEGTMVLYGRRISLHLMIQESILAQIMGEKGIEQQGFLPRCLLAFPSSTAGTRSYSHQDPRKNEALIHYGKRINALLDKEFPIEPPPAPQNELKPKTLCLTENAKAVWVKFHDEIDKELSSEGNLAGIRRFGSKAAEQVLRLAGILAMLDNPNVGLVDEKYIDRGIVLVRYYLSEIERIQGYLSIPINLVLAQKVLDWYRSKNKEKLLLRELYQYGPSELREAKKAREIMLILEEHGWAKKTEKKDCWIISKT